MRMPNIKEIRDLVLLVGAFGAGLAAIRPEYGFIAVGVAAGLNFLTRFNDKKK